MGSKEKGKRGDAGASSPRARKGEFPIRAEDYELMEPIGDGATAVVRRARCLPLGGEVVAVKIMNLALRSEADVVCPYLPKSFNQSIPLYTNVQS